VKRLSFALITTVLLVRAADIKVDLGGEQVGKPPNKFEPMVGTD
jgi:hypothetical protein